jgi:hypothetical protein
MPTNNFSQNQLSTLAPYTRAVSVTASDSNDLAETTRAIHIHAGAASTPIKVTMAGDTTAVTLNLQTGFIYPLRVSRIWATGTTATTLIALY